MWTRTVLIALLVLGLTGQGWAQEKFELATLQNAAVATGNGTAMPVDRFTAVGVQVTIATTATVTFEVTQDGTTWASATCASVASTSGALVSTATATGTYQCNVAGMMQFRARISAWTSGAVTVTARATTAVFGKKGGGLPAVGSEGDCLLTSSSAWAAGACPGAGTGAPTTATYLTQTADATLSAEQAIGSLATGCMSSTTTTGVVATRTLTGTANQISVANGDCSGTPTFSIPTNPTLPGTTTGTFSGNLTGNVTGNADTATTAGAGDSATSFFSSGTIEDARLPSSMADKVFTGSILLPNGTAPPGTCSIGMIYFDNNATAGVNLYGCTASNTWTLLGDGGGAGSVATDTIWNVAGDLVVGSGADTAARLGIGTAGQVLGVNAGATAPEWKSTLTSLTSISFGADPGDGSPLNLSNNTCVNWELATPGTDKCLKVNASDQLDFNGTINLSGTGTGSLVVNGTTSGSLTITTADATAQAVTITAAAQTTGATVLTIPDRAGSNGTFAFTTGSNVATATALAANGTNCSAGQYARGVDASGNAEDCTAAAGGLASTDIDTSAELRTLVTDESGTGALLFADGAIGAATATTPAANDNDTSVATTAYVQTELTAYASDTVTFTNKTLTSPIISSISNTGTVTLFTATDTVVGKATTDTLTNKTYDTAGTGNSFTIPKRVYLPAAGCNNATAGAIWNLPTANAPAAACITGTNTQKGVLDFDATTDESAQVEILLPATWSGAIDANVLWLSGTTTGSVAWCIQLISSADAETDDPAYPAQATGNCVSDAAKGTANQLNVAALTSITATGVAAGELLHIQISRDPNETSTRTDNHAADARLVGVELIYRVTE